MQESEVLKETVEGVFLLSIGLLFMWSSEAKATKEGV